MTLAPSARAHYEGASRLEVSDPDRATGLYLKLADEGGVWGANALYAAGRLELERGRRERARQLLERYLREFPNGPNAQDAQLLLRRAK